MKDRNNRINDDAYFNDLEKKMMNYAKKNKHSKPKVFKLNRVVWYAAAAILLAIGAVTLMNQSKEIDIPKVAQTNSNTELDSPNAIKDPLEINIAQGSNTESTKPSKETIIIEDKVEAKVMNTVNFEQATEIIEEEITEEELLDLLTEEEIDELLKEYT